MHLFTASIVAETNSFAACPTGVGAFEEQGICLSLDDPGDLMGMRPSIQAVHARAAAEGWRVTQGLATAAQPMGPVVHGVYHRFRTLILDGLRQAMPVDGVVLILHGAMTTERCDDCEGDLLQAVRALVGPDIPVGVSLDLHCHFTRAMREATPILIACKEYPHTDLPDAATAATDLVIEVARHRADPVLVGRACPLMGLWPTDREPLRGFVSRLRALEDRPGILSVSLGHGMSYGDVPEAGAALWIVAQRGTPDIGSLADSLVQDLVAMREKIGVRFVGLDPALDRLAAWVGPKPLVLADVADNPGGGAMGDSSFILRALVERGMGKVALGAIWDPGLVQTCFEAGEGARFRMRVGGKSGVAAGDPVDVDASVMALRREHSQDDFGARADLGPSAWVRTACGVDVVLISRRQQVLGLDLFTGLGLDPTGYRGIVVKSMQHFMASFAPVVGEVIHVDTPGLMRSDFENIAFERRNLDFWPRRQI